MDIERNGNVTETKRKRSVFKEFCRSTSLHGWQYLSERHYRKETTKSVGKFVWSLIVAASIGVASFFLFTSVNDFRSKYVATSIDTTTASLHVCRFQNFTLGYSSN